MQLRASLLTILTLSAATTMVTLGGCGGAAGGKIMADTTILPYEAPDADEIAGVDPDEEAAGAEPAGTGAAPEQPNQ